MDTSYDPEAMTTLRAPFLSADYFTLADSRSELGDAFALGQNVIIVVEGIAYEVVGAEDSGDPIVIPELRVDVDQNEGGPDPSSDFTTNKQPENAITLPCPGSTLFVGLGIFVYLKRFCKRND